MSQLALVLSQVLSHGLSQVLSQALAQVLSPVLSNIGPPGLARNPDVWSQLVHWPRSWPAFHVPGPNFSELRNGTMSQQTQSDPTPSFFAVDPSDSAWSLRMGFHTLEQKFFSRPNFDPHGHGPSLVPSLGPTLSQCPLPLSCPHGLARIP